MYVYFNNPMSCFSASVYDLNALVCSPSVSPIVSPISINVVCRCMIFHVNKLIHAEIESNLGANAQAPLDY